MELMDFMGSLWFTAPERSEQRAIERSVLSLPYRSIEDPAKLRRILEATLLVEADLELPVLLRHVIDEALSMTGARYGALGVLNEDRTAL